MMPGPLRSTAGFTYIAALFLVVVMGIMMAAAGQSVRVIMKREREKELIFRGLQYRDAIELWRKKKPGVPLKDLKDLYEPTQSSNINRSDDRLIRKLYLDPAIVPEAPFRTVLDPGTKEIIGVASTSDKEPFKQDNFPPAIESFKGKKKYSEWEFVYKKQPQAGQGANLSNQQQAGQGANTPNQQQQLSMPLSVPEGN